ncbi:MAG: glycosyltransferase family 2 protein [Desulfovibrio sp.]|uniref:glycosyltransferase family 2 protein n=1 Tax=Desulfovibrio sp. TaxID=885 RepID=UPI0039E4AE53
MPPLVSVIIPAYNSRAHVARALSSLERQREKNLEVEIIVVDDGSTDGTADFVRSRFPLARCITQDHAGLAAARNTGINAATGDYIVFLDADDLLCRGCLRSGIEALSRHGADISVCLCLNYVEGKDEGHFWPLRQDQYPLHLWHSNISPVHTFMCKRAVFSSLRFTPLPACEDWFFWFQCGQAGFQFTCNTDGMAVYIHRREGLAQTIGGQRTDMRVHLDVGRHLQQAEGLPPEGLFSAAVAHLAGALTCASNSKQHHADNVRQLLVEAGHTLALALKNKHSARRPSPTDPAGLAEQCHILQACALACGLPGEASELAQDIRVLGQYLCPGINDFTDGEKLHAAWRETFARTAVSPSVMAQTLRAHFEPADLVIPAL